MKRKHMLIKVNVPGSEHTVGDGIVAPISLGVGGVADEDASDRTRCEFVRSGVGSARIAKAPENTQAIIRWGRTEEKMVRCIVPPWAARAKVKEKRSNGEGVRPETRRHISMEQERATQSFRVRRTRSARPFCWDVYGHVRRKIMPWCDRKGRTARLSNSFPLSV